MTRFRPQLHTDGNVEKSFPKTLTHTHLRVK